MAKMKVLSKLKAEPGMWVSAAKIPKIDDSEVLIKIHKTAICGTDLHIYNWDAWSQKTIPVPMHVGHEFVGEIVKVGRYVREVAVGDRVSAEGHITCGHCRRCRGGKRHLCINTVGVGVNRPGAFAEYLSVPGRNVFKVPEGIDDNLVAIFDPFGNAVHTALSFDMAGEDVLISGAGPIGIMAVAICRHVGARHIVITDINDYRLDLAAKMGATKAVNVKDCRDEKALHAKLQDTMKQLDMATGFDVGLEMSGVPTAINAMLDSMISGGKIAILGIPSREFTIHWDTIVWKGLLLKGIYGREMFETWYKMVTLTQGGLDISPVITHEFPVDDYLQGFELMKSGQCGKVILNWQ